LSTFWRHFQHESTFCKQLKFFPTRFILLTCINFALILSICRCWNLPFCCFVLLVVIFFAQKLWHMYYWLICGLLEEKWRQKMTEMWLCCLFFVTCDAFLTRLVRFDHGTMRLDPNGARQSTWSLFVMFDAFRPWLVRFDHEVMRLDSNGTVANHKSGNATLAHSQILVCRV
jgi:hypothetical protein